MNQDSKHSDKFLQPRSPWAWVPTLYLMEAVPYVLVNIISIVMFKRFGASNSDIAFYTSLLGFAWVIKPLWGPLVDLHHTKRGWTIALQVAMALIIAVTAGCLLGPESLWWTGTLVCLAFIAFLSATHDIAADGFYMEALDEGQQSLFVGVRSTFYRIATIIMQGVLVSSVGVMETRTGLQPAAFQAAVAPAGEVRQFDPTLAAQSDAIKVEPEFVQLQPGTSATVMLSLRQPPERQVTTVALQADVTFWQRTMKLGDDRFLTVTDNIDTFGFTKENWDVPQEVVLTADPKTPRSLDIRYYFVSGDAHKSWAIALGGIAFVMLGAALYHLVAMPKAGEPGPGTREGGSFLKSVLAILFIAAVPVMVYTLLYQGLYFMLFFEGSPLLTVVENAEVRKFLVNAMVAFIFIVAFSFRSFRAMLKERFTEFSNANSPGTDVVFYTFFSKPGIGRMIAFLLLYRLGEALLVRISALFLMDGVQAGGLGLSQAEYGMAYGIIGVFAQLAGGILGGIVVSRWGLKVWLLPMCLAINVPDLLYVYMAAEQPSFPIAVACIAGECFGYGFGFAAFMLYMLYIAGDGPHKTSHFALCTGFMALGMMLPGMVAGVIQEAVGYYNFFWIVCAATLPGFVMLTLIPLNRNFGKAAQ